MNPLLSNIITNDSNPILIQSPLRENTLSSTFLLKHNKEILLDLTAQKFDFLVLGRNIDLL